ITTEIQPLPKFPVFVASPPSKVTVEGCVAVEGCVVFLEVSLVALHLFIALGFHFTSLFFPIRFFPSIILYN
uniref:hypothetical protein n=1 Tax=Mycobacterium tuberculosis TaxID=1773 RepID=UPI00254C2093